MPGLRGMVPRWTHLHYAGFDPLGQPIERTVKGFTPVSYNTNAIISTGFSTRCAFWTSPVRIYRRAFPDQAVPTAIEVSSFSVGRAIQFPA